jgi:hypothetical protein
MDTLMGRATGGIAGMEGGGIMGMPGWHVKGGAAGSEVEDRTDTLGGGR